MSMTKFIYTLPVILVSVAIYNYVTKLNVIYDQEFDGYNQTMANEFIQRAESQTLNFMFWALFIASGLALQVRRKVSYDSKSLTS